MTAPDERSGRKRRRILSRHLTEIFEPPCNVLAQRDHPVCVHRMEQVASAGARPSEVSRVRVRIMHNGEVEELRADRQMSATNESDIAPLWSTDLRFLRMDEFR